MPLWSVAALVLVVIWVLLSMKTSRPDGTLLRTHAFRRLMFYVMPTRTESMVYFDELVPADALMDYVNRAGERFPVDFTHALVAAVNIALAENPRMNRFVVGRRLYHRSARFITFSMKRKQLDRGARLSAVKLQMKDGETFRDFCARINASIDLERSGKKTHADKEFDLFNALPRPVLRLAVPLMRAMDYYNILPASFIANDGMYTSVFLANLGSLGMGAGYHHLYEWGSCPLFLMVGRVEEHPVVVDGQVVSRRMMPVRFTFDERIDDGLNAGLGIRAFIRVVQNPDAELGCLAEDGSDAVPMWPKPDQERDEELAI